MHDPRRACATRLRAARVSPELIAPVHAAEPTSAIAENQKAHPTLRSNGPGARAEMCVPGAGIEPATRGFSVLAAKWPKPRNAKDFRRRGGVV